VDGVDVSVALIKDEKTGLVDFFPNKGRDMGAIDDLQLKFVGAGEKDPDTDQFLSGVWVPLSDEEKKKQRAEKLAEGVEALNRALNLATRVLLERCECPQGTSGAEKFPEGCDKGGATTATLAEELGLDLGDRKRSVRVKETLLPAIEQGLVRSVGQTQGLRWHWGRGSESR
jgi:hypothetical protein